MRDKKRFLAETPRRKERQSKFRLRINTNKVVKSSCYNKSESKYSANHHKVTANGVERRFALLRTGTELNSVPTSRQFEIKAE
ncbi:MAG: hypothetical protein U9Q58_08695, partial [Pseudomonadota bacterium]|nr:hypothetical protein [Pseudomonadota bacterium]